MCIRYTNTYLYQTMIGCYRNTFLPALVLILFVLAPDISNAHKHKKITGNNSSEAAVSDFKRSILNVFTAYQQSDFYSVKGNTRKENNFWNYQHTYYTKLKIPGEKFNMLYSFPFVTSPLDFVSIIKESDEFDSSFQSVYKTYEKKLLESFPASEGWTSSCIPNKESKNFSDLVFINDKYGSVILDYSRNPKGKHIIYLRFLLYSN